MTDPFEITDRDRAEGARSSHVPDRAEIRELLTRYFVGPIEEEHVERLATTFETQRDERRDGDQAYFESPIVWQGYAWKEEVSENRRHMAPIDHLLLMGHCFWLEFQNMNGKPFPEPKLYCPDVFVGVWEQVRPSQVSEKHTRWQLGSDGSFRSNAPDLQALRRWCVQRTYDLPTYTLTFKSEASEAAWTLYTVTVSPDELVGSDWSEREFRLRRIK